MTMLHRENIGEAIDRLREEDPASSLLSELFSLGIDDFAPDGTVIVNNIDHPGLWWRGVLGVPIVFGDASEPDDYDWYNANGMWGGL